MREHWRQWQERWRDPALTGLLGIQTFLLFGIRPLAAMIDQSAREGLAIGFGALSTTAGFAFMLLALVAAARTRGAALFMLGAITLSLGGMLLSLLHRSPEMQLLASMASLIFVTTVTLAIAKAVFGGGRVTYHRITGAIVVYFGLAQIFACLYELILYWDPHVLSGMDLATLQGHVIRREILEREHLIYFSFSALTASSYGDIVPLHPLAKSLANLETVVGQLFPATLLGRMVSLEIEGRKSAKSDGL